MPNKPSLIGLRFARLIVIADAPDHFYPNGEHTRKVICMCLCGRGIEVIAASLKNGNTKSCGCLKGEIGYTFLTHGHSRVGKVHPLYKVWAGMLQRCTNAKGKRYCDYGGRGITVCERWRDFKNFLEDMGPRPEGLTLERIDYNLGYCPENCKWDTWSNQARNKRSTTIYTVRGVTGCMLTLCEHFGIRFGVVAARIHRSKWTPEAAFTTPVKTRAEFSPRGVNRNYTAKGNEAVEHVPVRVMLAPEAAHTPATPSTALSWTTSAARVVAPAIAPCCTTPPSQVKVLASTS